MSAAPAPTPIDSFLKAEANAAAWMRFWGFADAKVTMPGSDGGIDVRSRTALAQVKWEASQVGRPALQRLVGARGNATHQLLFFTGAGYSAPAVEYANQMSIALFKYDLAGRVSPINSAARAVSQVSPGEAVRAPIVGKAPSPWWEVLEELTRSLFVLVGIMTLLLFIWPLSGESLPDWASGLRAPGLILTITCLGLWLVVVITALIQEAIRDR